MKKILSLVMGLLLFGTLLSACSNNQASSKPSSSAAVEQGNEKLKVVATIFPQYDFIREIAGDNIDLIQLLPPGAESHSYEPTPQDIIAIQNSDMFVYVGGDSDTWIKDILSSIDTTNTKVLSLVDMVETKNEEIVEGMEHSHDHHGHSHDEEINPADIKDRPLADWDGSWKTIETALANGSLDELMQAKATENSTDVETEKGNFAKLWKSDYPTISIDGDKVTMGGETSAYKYVGYKLVEGDHGNSVWYGFEAEAPSANIPKIIAFTDHEIESHSDEADHEHDHEGLPHFHLLYGNESFDDLVKKEGWFPTYFPENVSDADIAKGMMDHAHDHEDEEGHEHELDEHVWTSPKNAQEIVKQFEKTLAELDPDNAEVYQQNAKSYIEKLSELDKSFEEAVKDGARKTIVVGDRFPLRYLADAYDLNYYAAFSGCSTQTDPSASTVAFLIDKVKEEKIPVVFHIELSNEKLADTICSETGAEKRLMHSCHNLSQEDLKAGETYLSIMQKNVVNLKEALQQ